MQVREPMSEPAATASDAGDTRETTMGDTTLKQRSGPAVPADEESATSRIVRRYRDVATVLVRHGLADIVEALHLGPYLAWGVRMLPTRARPDPSLSRAARLRLTLEELGPTFVKFGQALSVRADVLPADVVGELSRLQEHVAPLQPGAAEAAIEAELGQPVAVLFRHFDPAPLAAGSMAQVHRATLHSGESVAVKVRRPGIGRMIASDIEILRRLARLVERRVPAAEVANPTGLVEEFAWTIRAEQDFRREARNLERCAANFSGDRTVRFPRVYRELTTSGVLTMEYLAGARVSELEAAGVDASERRLIAERGADAILAQTLEHGFFHADPHPGNLLVLPGAVIGFLDLGIVGRLDRRLRRELSRVVRAIWRQDAAELGRLTIEITEPAGDVDARAIERDLSRLLEAYGNVPLADLSAAAVLSDVVAVAARYRLRMPANLMLLIKTLVTIEGVGLQLDPSFRIVEHAAPRAEAIWRREYSPEVLGRRAARAVQDALVSARDLPQQVEAIGRKIRDGRLEIRFVHRNLDHFVREMDRSSNRLAFAMIIAALIVGSSLVIQSGRGAELWGYPVFGLVGFVVAGLFGVRLAIGIVRSGRL